MYFYLLLIIFIISCHSTPKKDPNKWTKENHEKAIKNIKNSKNAEKCPDIIKNVNQMRSMFHTVADNHMDDYNKLKKCESNLEKAQKEAKTWKSIKIAFWSIISTIVAGLIGFFVLNIYTGGGASMAGSLLKKGLSLFKK